MVMSKILRSIQTSVANDLQKKMVFISGPRQVGKTTLAKSFIKNSKKISSSYLNWDNLQDRLLIKSENLPSEEPLIIFDEIHKYVRWRNLIKGLYDKYNHQTHFIVTGSAKLDYFRKGGDSLFGRYYHYRLHPISLCELNAQPTLSDVKQLMQYGGFPYPLFAESEIEWKRWQMERKHKIIFEDLRDLESVREVTYVDLLMDALPERVGSPLSIKSLAEDLQVNHASIQRWIEILERLYMCFRISPFGAPKIRAVKKEQKLYLWDWSSCQSEGSKFENLVACQLLKHCHYLEDVYGEKMELRYVRDTDKREIDFVVIKNKKPEFAVECKLNDQDLSPHIKYFSERTGIPKFYQVHLGHKDYGNPTTIGRSLPYMKFVQELDLL